MSESKLLKTDSLTADGGSVKTKSNRLFNWVSRYRWYLAGSFLVLIVARSEAKRAETPAMQANRRTIESMSRVERDRLRHNQQQFHELLPHDIKRVSTIHDAIQNDSKLGETVSGFHTWLATLSLPQREKLLATSEAHERLQMVRQLMAASESTIPNREFARPTDMTARLLYSNLRLSPGDYERMMISAAEWAKVPARPETDSPVSRLEFHTSVFAGIMDRIAPSWRVPVSRSTNRTRLMFPDELRSILLGQLSNSSMKKMIESRAPAQQNLMAMILLARGLFDESRRAVQALRPSDAELNRIHESFPEPRRNSLDAMPKEISQRYLQLFWLSHRLSPQAGENLSRLWSLFEKLLNRPLNGQRGGFGTKRTGRDGAGIPPSGDRNRKGR